MRADFYQDLMNSPLWPVDRSQIMDIAPLRGEALRRAITGPAEAVGVCLEEGLTDRLVVDAANEPGALPMLQEALVLLWSGRERRLLTRAAYDALGREGRSGLAVAMSSKADATLAVMAPEERRVARRIFLRLVQFGEGRPDTRRQMAVDELRAAGDLPGMFDRVLEELIENRLLTLTSEGSTGRRVDIAHEMLIVGWPASREWVQSRRAAELGRRRLEAKADEWVRLGRGRGGLLDVVEMTEAETWLKGTDAADVGYKPSLAELVDASRMKIDDETLREKRLSRRIIAGLTVGFLVVAVSAILLRRELIQKQQADAARALAQVENLRTANPQAVPALIEIIRQHDDAMRVVRQQRADPRCTEHDRVRLGLALLREDPKSEAPGLFQEGLRSDPPEESLLIIKTLVATLGNDAQGREPELWTTFEDPATDPQILRAAVVLAQIDPSAGRWDAAGARVVSALLSDNPIHLRTWIDALRPVGPRLLPHLRRAFRSSKDPGERRIVCTVVADYAADQPDVLYDLIQDADDGRQFEILLPLVALDRDRADAALRAVLAKAPTADAAEDDREELAGRQANAAVALFRLGDKDPLWKALVHGSDPRCRTFLIHRLGPFGVDSKDLIHRLADEQVASVRAAILMALGQFTDWQVPDDLRRPLADYLLEDYARDPDPGVHAAAGWLLVRWGHDGRLRVVEQPLAGPQSTGGRFWYVNKQGQTMVVIRGPQSFAMGSPLAEPGRNSVDERLHHRKIPRSFAVAAREVTVREFRLFLEQVGPDKVSFPDDFQKEYSPDPEGPINSVSWFQAAQYCRWLSEKEGVAHDQMVYPEVADIKPGMTMPAGYLERTGYRLPTEAEWEFVCRAGTQTPWECGGATYLTEYAQYLVNSAGRFHEQAWPTARLKPNRFGLFDLHGNVIEWCQDAIYKYPQSDWPAQTDGEEGDLTVPANRPRHMRGGSFADLRTEIRSANRDTGHPLDRDSSFGFRVARTVSNP